MKNLLKKLLFTFAVIILLIVVLYPFTSNASPSSSLYSFKRLEENIMLLIKISPDAKAAYYSKLLDTRLHELEGVIAKRQNYILPTSLRYAAIAGQYTDVIKQNNLQERANEARKQFAQHKIILTKLEKNYERFGDTDDTWKFIRDSINYIDIYSSQLPK